MKLKKFLLALGISLLAFCLVACAKDDAGALDSDSGTADANVSDTATEEAVSAYLDLVKDGTCVDIIYSLSADSETLNIVNSTVDSLKKMGGLSGVRPKVENKHDPDKVEILIGDVKYPESQQVYKELGYGDAVVKVVGKKLVVAGFNINTMKRAMNSLTIAMSKGRDESGNIRIAADYTSLISDTPLASAVPKIEGETPTIIDAGDNTVKMSFAKKTLNDAKTYAASLEAKGFTKYAENTLENLTSFTYSDNTHIVTVLHTAYNSMLKVLVEPLSSNSLPGTAAENQYTDKGIPTTFAQIGLYYDDNKASNEAALNMKNMNGICDVIQLADGSFIILDGGHAAVQADNLYKYLQKQAPNKSDIRIAAWFFSHDHGDHTGFFSTFVEKYSSKVKVERFVFNFNSEAMQGSAPGQANGVRTSIGAKFSDAKFIKAHPGQVFYIRNAVITMLYSYDVNEDVMTDTNNASIVFRMDVEGKRVLFTGDYSENGKHLMKLYTTKTLQSDVMQFPHHAISGMANDQFYAAVAPTYGFWPVAMVMKDSGNAKAGHVYWQETNEDGSLRKIDVDLLGREANKYIVETMDYPNKVFVALDDIYVMTLDDPNTADNISVVKYEDITRFLNGTQAS